MKKTAIILLALMTAVILLFTACDRGTLKDDGKTTTRANVTTTERAGETTTEPDTRDMLTTDQDRDDAGVPESTNQDSAIGDAIEDAAEGAADLNEDIADGVRDMENDNG